MAIFNFGHQFFLSFGSHIFQSIRNLCDSALFETIEKKGGGDSHTFVANFIQNVGKISTINQKTYIKTAYGIIKFRNPKDIKIHQ